MQFLKKGKNVLILAVVLVMTASWGFFVHRTVAQLSVYELPESMAPFFFQNMDYLVTNAPRPDMRRNQDSTEAPKHFIDLELYAKNGINNIPTTWAAAVKQYSRDTLEKDGYVPYEIMMMKDKLTQAFKGGNKDSILFYATDLAHYIGDANVPLHTSMNYDGQLTNQKGLHSLWETMIPELELTNYNLSSTHKATYLTKPAEAIWESIHRSFLLVGPMLEKEKEVSTKFTEEQKFRTQIRNGRESKSYTTEFARAYSAALGKSINEQLLRSADQVADFWYTCWVDAGKPDLSSITNWTPADADKYKKEMAAFSANTLIENKMLISKKPREKAAE